MHPAQGQGLGKIGGGDSAVHRPRQSRAVNRPRQREVHRSTSLMLLLQSYVVFCDECARNRNARFCVAYMNSNLESNMGVGGDGEGGRCRVITRQETSGTIRGQLRPLIKTVRPLEQKLAAPEASRQVGVTGRPAGRPATVARGGLGAAGRPTGRPDRPAGENMMEGWRRRRQRPKSGRLHCRCGTKGWGKLHMAQKGWKDDAIPDMTETCDFLLQPTSSVFGRAHYGHSLFHHSEVQVQPALCASRSLRTGAQLTLGAFLSRQRARRAVAPSPRVAEPPAKRVWDDEAVTTAETLGGTIATCSGHALLDAPSRKLAFGRRRRREMLKSNTCDPGKRMIHTAKGPTETPAQVLEKTLGPRRNCRTNKKLAPERADLGTDLVQIWSRSIGREHEILKNVDFFARFSHWETETRAPGCRIFKKKAWSSLVPKKAPFARSAEGPEDRQANDTQHNMSRADLPNNLPRYGWGWGIIPPLCPHLNAFWGEGQGSLEANNYIPDGLASIPLSPATPRACVVWDVDAHRHFRPPAAERPAAGRRCCAETECTSWESEQTQRSLAFVPPVA
eukprot:gene10066-biopygen9300